MTPFVESQVEEAPLAWTRLPAGPAGRCRQNVLQRAEALSSEWAA